MFNAETIQSLNDLELEVYKYVVRNADKVCYMRIREFADAAHVSTSTILRFCKKAGCDGYAEFKIRLRQHLEQAKQPPVKDDVSEVIDFLKKTCSAEFEQKLDMLTRVIFHTSLTILSPIQSSPELISSRPAIIRSVVDLPHPEGPTKIMNSLSSISKLKSFTALKPFG